MLKRAGFSIIFVSIFFGLARSGHAQGIAGIIKDQTGAVLPGVTVEAASPALIEATRSGVTDEQGQYKIVNLRPGTYSVTFSLTGFSTVKREGIELIAGFTAAINVELKPGGIEETITVSGQSPIVDVQNVAQTRVMTREIVDAIPTGKTFAMLANLVPGMSVGGGGVSVGQDVGGQSGGTSQRLMIHGGTVGDQQVYRNGFRLQILSTDGAALVEIPTDGAIQEYNLETAGHSAEAETSGVRVNMIPKEGGNVFSGSYFANYGGDRLQGDNYTQELKNRGLKQPNSNKFIWATNGSLGGPVMKSKMWFFTSWAKSDLENYVANLYYNADPQSWVYTADLSRPMVYKQTVWSGTGNMTWQVSPRNKLNVYYEHNKVCNCFSPGGTGAIVAPEATNRWLFLSRNFQALWSAPISNRLLVQVGHSEYPVHWDGGFQEFSSGHPITESAGALAGIRYSAPTSGTDVFSHVHHTKGSVSYVTGSHAMKFGAESVLGWASRAAFVPGNAAYTLLNGVPNSVNFHPGPLVPISQFRPNLGLYGQDQFTVARLTVTGGLRFDVFKSSYPDLHAEPTQYLPITRDFPGASVLSWKDLSPRLGLAYDLFGNTKTALKTSVTRAVGQQATALTDLINPINTTAGSASRQWTDLNRDFIIQGDPFNPAVNLELGTSNNQNFGKLATPQTVIDPKFANGFGVRPSNWEFSAGLQHQITSGLSASVEYFRRVYSNFQVTDNVAIAPSDYSTYCVTAPQDTRLPGSGGNQICGLFDVDPAKRALISNVITRSTTYGNQRQHFDGIDITGRARMRLLTLQGGMSTGTTMSDNCDVVTRIDNPSSLYCHVETPFFLPSVKFLGAYTLPWDVQFAGAFQSSPGPNVLANATFTNAQIAPSLLRNLAAGPSGTAVVPLVEPGTIFGDRLNQLDVRLAKLFKTRHATWRAALDVYNTLNAHAVLLQNNNYGTTGASWQVPTAVVPARLAKFEIQIAF